MANSENRKVTSTTFLMVHHGSKTGRVISKKQRSERGAVLQFAATYETSWVTPV